VAVPCVLLPESWQLVHPPNKEVIKNLSLSYYYGAKIGVLGPNGSGKSTLLRIMANVDTEFTREAKAAQDTTIGYLAQEPRARARRIAYRPARNSMRPLGRAARNSARAKEC
jgi:ATPase subunit of ABC transporter with duplicated ATPase domains